MTDSVHAWLDPDEVRRLAASLADHAPAADDSAPAEPGFSSNFVGFTHDGQANAAHADSSVAAPAVAATLPERLAEIATELARETSAIGLFAVTPAGEVIFGEATHPEFHFGAKALAEASPADPARRVRWKIGATRHLELIPVQTRSGPIVLGTVVSKPIAFDRLVAILRRLDD